MIIMSIIVIMIWIPMCVIMYVYIKYYGCYFIVFLFYMATCQTMFGLRVPFGGTTRHRLVIPGVIPQFHLVGMTALWRVAV